MLTQNCPVCRAKWGDVCFSESVLYTQDQFGGAACVNIRIPWWWHAGNAETGRKETVRRLCLIFSTRIVGSMGWNRLLYWIAGLLIVYDLEVDSDTLLISYRQHIKQTGHKDKKKRKVCAKRAFIFWTRYFRFYEYIQHWPWGLFTVDKDTLLQSQSQYAIDEVHWAGDHIHFIY